jgi:hypothetical protein
VAAMIDPRVSDLSRSVDPEAMYLHEIRKAAQIHRVLRNAQLIDGPRGWDASMYHASRYVDGRVVLVGDAGSFIDPLSSAGVKKALASGWLAAVTTHTCLIKPQMRTTALGFFEQREREIYHQFRAMTESYWRDAAAGHAHPFWNDRVADADASQQDRAVQEAYERLRTAPALQVEVAPAVRVADRAAVSGAEIVLEPRLVRHDHDPGVRFAHDVDLIMLVQLAPAFTSVPDLFEAYNRRAAPVALPEFLAALAASIAHQWLRWCDKT